MAKTYYKYKERGGIVDYAAISKDFSTGISGIIGDIEQGADELTEDILKAQEGVKADVEKEIRAKEAEKARARAEAAARSAKVAAASKTDFNPEMSKEKEANDKFIQAAIQAQNKALEFKRQRDNQQISDSEYLQKMGALEKTFAIMKQASVAVNDMANRTYSGLEDGTVDPVQQLALKEVLSYNFTDPNIRFEIGEDGYGVVYRVDKEGNVVENTKRPVDFVKNLAIQEFKSYDVNKETGDLVDMIGKTIEEYRGRGMTNEDLLEKQGIMPSIYGGPDITPMYLIDEYAEGLDDNQLASVMTNVLGSKYKPTFNPEEQVKVDDEGNFYVDEMKILYTDSDPALGLNNRVAQLTESQRSKAREYVKSLILTQFNVKKQPTTSGRAPSSAQIKASEARERARGYVTALQDLFTADDHKKRSAAMANLAGAIGQDRFISMEMNDSGDAIVFTGIDKDDNVRKTQEIPLEGTFDDFVKNYGKILTGTGDVWTYYDEVIDSPDVSSLTPSVGAGGKYEIGFEESLAQELPAFDQQSLELVADSKLDGTYLVFGNQLTDFTNATNTVLLAANINGAEVTVSGNDIKISHPELGSTSFTVESGPLQGSAVRQIKSEMMRAVKKMYDAAKSGRPIESSAAGDEEEKLRASLKTSGMTDEEIEEIINAD